MSEKVLDHKGNEVKEGMTIYFVQTKPFNLGRMGLLIPAGNTTTGERGIIMESDEDYKKRNEPIWELSDEMIVKKDEYKKLYVTLIDNNFSCKVYLDGGSSFGEKPILAIKGISDKQF